MQEKQNRRFEYLVEEVIPDVMDKLEEEYDSNHSEHIFSKEHEKEMKQLFNKLKAKERLNLTFEITKKLVTSVMILGFIFSAVAFGVKAYKAKIFNYIFEQNKQYTMIVYGKEPAYSNGKLRMMYLPEEFKLSKSQFGEAEDLLKFSREENYIILHRSNKKASLGIDTEDSTIERINYLEKSFLVIEKNSDSTIIINWEDDFNIYTLCGNLEKEEILKIAYNIWFDGGEE